MKIRYDYTVTGSMTFEYSDDELKELLHLEDTDEAPTLLGQAELSDLEDTEAENGYEAILNEIADNAAKIRLKVSQIHD